MLSIDFVAGLVSASGSFMFVIKGAHSYPVFQMKTSFSNAGLLQEVLDTLEIRKSVYRYTRPSQSYSQILIRDRESIINKLIPLLDGRLEGEKRLLFEHWKQQIFESSSTWNYRNIQSTVNPHVHGPVDKKPNSLNSTRSVESG